MRPAAMIAEPPTGTFTIIFTSIVKSANRPTASTKPKSQSPIFPEDSKFTTSNSPPQGYAGVAEQTESSPKASL